MMWVVLSCILVSLLVQNMGLAENVALVVQKIASCPKCLTFWSTLTLCLLLDTDIFVSIALSTFAAYASYWFSLALFAMNNIYESLWEELKRKRRRKTK